MSPRPEKCIILKYVFLLLFSLLSCYIKTIGKFSLVVLTFSLNPDISEFNLPPFVPKCNLCTDFTEKLIFKNFAYVVLFNSINFKLQILAKIYRNCSKLDTNVRHQLLLLRYGFFSIFSENLQINFPLSFRFTLQSIAAETLILFSCVCMVAPGVLRASPEIGFVSYSYLTSNIGFLFRSVLPSCWFPPLILLQFLTVVISFFFWFFFSTLLIVDLMSPDRKVELGSLT